MSHKLKILLTVVILGAVGGGLFTTAQSEAEFYKHVDEVLKEPERFDNKSLQIHGFVEAGSIQEELADQTIKRSFILEYNGQRIRVHHQGTKPDTFRDLSEVVAKGTLVMRDGEYMLDANDLTAKCPSKYEESRRDKNKQVSSQP